MYDRPLTIEQILTLLAATPARLADLTDGLPPVQLLLPPSPVNGALVLTLRMSIMA